MPKSILKYFNKMELYRVIGKMKLNIFIPKAVINKPAEACTVLWKCGMFFSAGISPVRCARLLIPQALQPASSTQPLHNTSERQKKQQCLNTVNNCYSTIN